MVDLIKWLSYSWFDSSHRLDDYLVERERKEMCDAQVKAEPFYTKSWPHVISLQERLLRPMRYTQSNAAHLYLSHASNCILFLDLSRHIYVQEPEAEQSSTSNAKYFQDTSMELVCFWYCMFNCMFCNILCKYWSSCGLVGGLGSAATLGACYLEGAGMPTGVPGNVHSHVPVWQLMLGKFSLPSLMQWWSYLSI